MFLGLLDLGPAKNILKNASLSTDWLTPIVTSLVASMRSVCPLCWRRGQGGLSNAHALLLGLSTAN